MKLAGYKKKGRHLQKNVPNGADHADVENTGIDTGKNVWYKRILTKSAILKVLIGLSVCLVAAVAILMIDIIFKREVIIKPPPVEDDPRRPAQTDAYDPTIGIPPPVQTDNPDTDKPDETSDPNLRKPNTFTFLVLGIDGQVNTDVIMIVTFDAENYTFNVVNIPRDTLTNVEWNVKKANQIVYNMRKKYQGQDDAENKAMQGAKEVFADILGYKVDYWITIDMRGFVALINAIGGVDFYVPINMDYDDPAQNLHIHYTKGMKNGLTGQQVLEIIRFRSGYASKDIGRIGTQQLLLKATAEQLLSKRNSLNIVSLADTFFKYVKTDLALNHIVWLGRELLKMDAENVQFVTMPGNNMDSVNGSSYVSIYVDEWLEVINTMLNPLTEDITLDNLSILTRGADKKLYVTDGNRQGDPAWGATSRAPGASGGTSSGGTSGNPGSNPAGNSGASPSPSPTPGPSTGESGNPPSGPSPSPGSEPGDSPGQNPDPDDAAPQESTPGGDEPPADNPETGGTETDVQGAQTEMAPET